MLAHYFLAAVIEVVESAERHGHPRPNILDLVRGLPWGRLIAADVILRAASIVGYFVFVVPGVLIATYTLIALPLINMERRPVVPTIRRSIDLVRGHFVTAFLIWALVTGGTLGLEEIAAELTEALTHSHIGEYLGHLATEVLILPLAALPVVMLAFDLVACRHGEHDARSPHQP
jgi:hypothetical protein